MRRMPGIDTRDSGEEAAVETLNALPLYAVARLMSRCKGRQTIEQKASQRKDRDL